MLRWVFLVVAIASFAVMWGMGPRFAPYIAFGVMFANFATFCLLYDRPMEQARHRIKMRLLELNPNTDTAQRLQTAKLRPTEKDRELGHGPMVQLNFATGLASFAFLAWGIVLRALA